MDDYFVKKPTLFFTPTKSQNIEHELKDLSQQRLKLSKLQDLIKQSIDSTKQFYQKLSNNTRSSTKQQESNKTYQQQQQLQDEAVQVNLKEQTTLNQPQLQKELNIKEFQVQSNSEKKFLSFRNITYTTKGSLNGIGTNIIEKQNIQEYFYISGKKKLKCKTPQRYHLFTQANLLLKPKDKNYYIGKRGKKYYYPLSPQPYVIRETEETVQEEVQGQEKDQQNLDYLIENPNTIEYNNNHIQEELLNDVSIGQLDISSLQHDLNGNTIQLSSSSSFLLFNEDSRNDIFETHQDHDKV